MSLKLKLRFSTFKPDRLLQQHNYNYNYKYKYSAVTARNNITAKIPTCSTELMREFIYDCLYNPTYGYFSKNVNIFNSPEPINFKKLKDQDDYFRVLKSLYDRHAQTNLKFHQLWHTPSELFKPFYGRAISKFLTANTDGPLVIYEIGPGNGTLAKNILDCLREEQPEIYDRVEYNLIEISEQLKAKQAETLKDHKIAFTDISILKLPEGFKEERPCWILGMEVLDNLSHDLIKFRNDDGALLEAVVHTDNKATYGSVPGKYWRDFRESSDQIIQEYVAMGDELGWRWASLRGNPIRRLIERYSSIEYINPWSCEYIPTDAFKMLKGLAKAFPNHRALFSDFDELPDTVEGHCGPVVQTRFRGVTVPCSSVLLERGLFDIFFPTNFSRLAQIHQKLHTKHRTYTVQKHSAFMQKWLNPEDIEATSTRSGYNPMLQDFENVSFYSCT